MEHGGSTHSLAHALFHLPASQHTQNHHHSTASQQLRNTHAPCSDTGQFVAAEALRSLPPGTRITIAGRSEAKLQALVTQLDGAAAAGQRLQVSSACGCMYTNIFWDGINGQWWQCAYTLDVCVLWQLCSMWSCFEGGVTCRSGNSQSSAYTDSV